MRSQAPPIVHDILRSSGQPLDTATRDFMEPRLGADLSSVRVHADDEAGRSARAVNALAYTVGRDVVFDPAHYAPNTTPGRKLMAHELAHVVQQGADADRPFAAVIEMGGAEDAAEAAAEKAAHAALAEQPVSVSATAERLVLRRQPPTPTQTPAPTQSPTPRQPAGPTVPPPCEGQADITAFFRQFVQDVPALLATVPGLGSAEAARLSVIADTVLHSEGAADIDNFTVVSCTAINSPLIFSDEKAGAFVDAANKTLALGTDLVDGMKDFRTAPTREGLLPILTTVAHEKRHVILANAAAVLPSALGPGVDPSATENSAYRVEEILTVAEEINVSRQYELGYRVPVEAQQKLRRQWNTVLNYVTPAEASRLRDLVIATLRDRYGFSNGCDEAITVGVVNSMETGQWHRCDTDAQRVVTPIPTGLNVCEVDGRHPICPSSAQGGGATP